MNATATIGGVLPKIVAIVFLAALFVLFGGLSRQCLKDGPLSIVHLELAPTVAKANAFLNAWRNFKFPPNHKCPGVWQTKLQTGQAWDTWFICAYAPLFTLLCWFAAGHFEGQQFARLSTLGYVLAGAQLFAGVLDFVENASINKMIARGFAFEPWPQISATASGIKWFLILAFFGYGAAALLHWLASLVDRH